METIENNLEYIDIHIHSTYSDGTYTPLEILKLAEKQNLTVISITDHNNVDAFEEIKNTPYNGIVLRGCEITTTYNGEIIEILAYKVNEKFRERLAEIRLSQRDAKQRQYKVSCITIDTLAEKGVKFRNNYGDEFYKNPKQFYDTKKESSMDGILREIKRYEENAKFFGGLENMLKITTNEFVRNMIYNPKSIFYIDQTKLYPSLEKVLEIIHECDGLAFLAHLYVYSETIAQNLDNIVKNYKLDGLECYYTLFTKEQTEYLTNYCKKKKLYMCGGSDFHGKKKKDFNLGTGKGNLRISKEIIEQWL